MTKAITISEEFEAIKSALEALEPLQGERRKFAVTMVLTRLGMTDVQVGRESEQRGRGGGEGGAGMTAGAGKPSNAADVRSFLRQKSPATDLERYVCLAYYLTHYGNTPAFTSRDITRLNGEAGGHDFSNAAVTAGNALRQSKLLNKAGHGKKRITLKGEQLVEALPDRQKVKEVIKSKTRKPSKTRSKK
jgi:hypothetical protein